MPEQALTKTMENLRNRRKIKFLTTPIEAKVFTLEANFPNFQIIHDTLVSVNSTQSSIFWSKPTSVGAAKLDLSKIVLYDFHYNEMIKRFGSNLSCL